MDNVKYKNIIVLHPKDLASNLKNKLVLFVANAKRHNTIPAEIFPFIRWSKQKIFLKNHPAKG